MTKSSDNQPTPLSPDTVFNAINNDHVDDEVRRINQELRKKMEAGLIKNEGSIDVVIFDRNLSYAERIRVGEMFVSEGWSKVKSQASALICWTLYR